MSREWEEIQQRTFTRWVNAQLKKRGMKIDDLSTDLADGIALINLYEIISDEDLGKYNKKPRMKIHQLENLKIVVTEINKFVSSVGIRVQYSGSSIMDDSTNELKKKNKMRDILGMIWCLIHKFAIQDISEEELSAKEGLLLWCKKNTKGYQGCNVKNFHTSWQDGLAFCALINKFYPDQLDYDKLDPKDKKGNLQKAFDIAEKEHDIPQLLDANDMVSYKPDEKSVMTYAAYYWKKFAAGNKQQKHGKKIARVAKSMQDNKKMELNYEKRAKALNKGIDEKDKSLVETDQKKFGNCLADVQVKQKSFNNFKKKEKPVLNKEKNELAILLINLKAKQKNEFLKVYNPPKELSTAAIQGNWDKLGVTQKAYEKALKEAIQKMKYLERLLQRFNARSKKILNWQKEKTESLDDDVPKDITIAKLRAETNMLNGFEDEHKSIKTAQTGAIAIGKEIIEAEHKAADQCMDQTIEMKKGDAVLEKKSKEKKEKLEALLKVKLEIEQWALDFSTLSEKLNLFLEDANLSLSEPVSATSVKEVEQSLAVLEKIVELHKESAALEKKMAEIEKKVKDAGGDPHIYSRFTHEKMKKKYDDCKVEFEERKKELDAEMKQQIINEKLLGDFSKQSKDYVKWTAETVKTITEEKEGDLEEALVELQKVGAAAVKDSTSKLKDLVEIINNLEEADIVEQAEFSTQELQVLDDQIKSTFSKRARAIDEQILQNKNSSIKPEQLKDFKETFTYFDKDNSGKLNKNEFKAACAAVGEDIADNELDSVFKEFDKDKDNQISFEEFISFMTSVAHDGTSMDDVVNSFKSLAGGKDFITEGQIRGNMDKEDADYLLSVMPKIKDGCYDYLKYAKETCAAEDDE